MFGKEIKKISLVYIVGLVLCVLFGLTLLCNIIIIVKGTLNPDRPPSVFSVTPMVVMSGSMSGDREGHIEVGDLIFLLPAEPKELAEGDVIAFMEEGSKIVVTHRIIELKEAADGTREFVTKGDANNTADKPIAEDRLVGRYKWRIPAVGNLAIFMQTPIGTVVFVGIPLLAFIIYDIIRRQKNADREEKKTAELQAEIDRLKALHADEDGGETGETGEIGEIGEERKTIDDIEAQK